MAQTASQHPAKAHRKTGGADRAAQRGRTAASGAAQEDLQWGEEPHALADAVAGLQRGWGNRATSAALDAKRHGMSNGQPLPVGVCALMESRFGTDFGRVRVHNDAQAHEHAQALSAKAFTRGEHITFSADRFAPHSAAGQRLLAHELAHVVQQRRGGAAPVRSAQAPQEQAAHRAAEAVASNPQAPVAVQGATAVGLACDDEDERSWYDKLRDKVPPQYRKMAKDAVKGAADGMVDSTATALLGPAGSMLVPSGLGSGLVERAADAVRDGAPAALENLKGAGRDHLLGGLGALSGVVKQVSEVADTGLWVGDEYANARDKVASLGGDKNSWANRVITSTIDLAGDRLSLPQLAEASKEAKDAGLTDDLGRASLTAPFSRWINDKAKQVEETVGGTPSDPLLFTPFEQKEMEAAIGVQVALAFTGAEEVKVALNVVGALQSLRTTVETVRRSDNWKSDPNFWGGLIGISLSIVGLKHAAGATKFTTLLMKFGWTLQAVPLLLQMKDVYFTEGLSDEEREQRVKALWAQVIHVLKDAILHVAQSQGIKPTKGSPAAANAEAGEGGQAPPPKLAPAKPADTGAQLDVPAPVVSNTTAKPQAPVGPPADAPNPVPIASGKSRSKSARSVANDNHLAETPKGSGKVRPIRKDMPKPPDKPAGPSTEPQSAALPPPIELHPPVELPMVMAKASGSKDTFVGDAPRASLSGPPKGAGPKLVQTPGKGPVNTQGRPPAGPGPAAPARGGAAAPSSANAKGKVLPLRPVAKAAGPGAGNSSVPAQRSPQIDVEPLVVVKVRGRNKGEFWPEGSAQFKSNAGSAKAPPNAAYVVLPESQAVDLGFRAAGTPAKITIVPITRGGEPVESLGAGRTSAGRVPDKGETPRTPAHPITARTARQSGKSGKAGKNASNDMEMPKGVEDPKAKDAFNRMTLADQREAQGYRQLINDGEQGLLRPGNVSTGGVDAITARIGADGKADVFLNDFTTPGAAKSPKATHQQWKGELDNLVRSGRVQFADPQVQAAVLKAINENPPRVFVRTVRVDFPAKATLPPGSRPGAGTLAPSLVLGQPKRVD
jgi:hypothetical protein